MSLFWGSWHRNVCTSSTRLVMMSLKQKSLSHLCSFWAVSFWNPCIQNDTLMMLVLNRIGRTFRISFWAKKIPSSAISILTFLLYKIAVYLVFNFRDFPPSKRMHLFSQSCDVIHEQKWMPRVFPIFLIIYPQ